MREATATAQVVASDASLAGGRLELVKRILVCIARDTKTWAYRHDLVPSNIRT